MALLITLVLISLQSFGQQSTLYTQYYNNFSILNPAYVGSQGVFTSTLNSRTEWAGEEGGPQTYSFSLHGPSGKKVGLGLSIINDKISVLSETHVFADFSYSVATSDNSTLAFGLKAGGSFLDVDLLQLGIEEDPLFAENINQFNPNIGAGAYYYNDKFYASLSTINILDTKRNDLDNSIVSSASDRMVFYMSSGYIFDMGGSIKLRPSVMFRTANGSPSATDLAASLIWNDAIEFGISHRFDVATSALVQINISDNLKLGYAYDAITSDLSDFVSGSHEISLVINWGAGKSNKAIIPAQEKETTVPEPQAVK